MHYFDFFEPYDVDKKENSEIKDDMKNYFNIWGNNMKKLTSVINKVDRTVKSNHKNKYHKQ